MDGLLSELEFSVYRGACNTPYLLIEREPGIEEAHVGIHCPKPQPLVRLLLLLDLLSPILRQVAHVISLSFENLYSTQEGVLSELHIAIQDSNCRVGNCLIRIMHSIDYIPRSFLYSVICHCFAPFPCTQALHAHDSSRLSHVFADNEQSTQQAYNVVNTCYLGADGDEEAEVA